VIRIHLLVAAGALALAAGCANLAPETRPVAAAPAAQRTAPVAERIARVAIVSPVKPKVTRLEKAPASALFVGNSFFYYNNSMHNHFGRLVSAAEPRVVPSFRSTSATVSGSGIDWHPVDAYFRPPFASYSFDAKNNIVFNKLDRPFDVAIIMDCSQCPIHPQLKPLLHEYAKKNSETVRKHGAAPVLFMSWAYEDVPEMTAQLAAEYTTAANANDALVIPAGLAFAKALHKRPNIKLYADDKRHPSLEGTYLAACTVYAALYGRSPESIKYTAGIDPSTAAFLQSVAWETVREYYGR
jgi:hypothetical protein